MKIFARQNTLGLRLKHERERLGLTQVALAKATGVARLTIIKYELGDRSPSADFLIAIRDVGLDIFHILAEERPTVNIDVLSMEKAVELLLSMARELGAKPDPKVMTQALLHFYKSMVSNHTSQSAPRVSSEDATAKAE